MKNHIKQLMSDANRYFESDNRCKATNGINTILSKGDVKIEIQEYGHHWTNDNYKKSNGDLKPFNVIIRGFGWRRRVFLKSWESLSIAQHLSHFLLGAGVQEKIGIKYKAHQPCSRCGGRGIISQYKYYCNGICFGCYGSGIDNKLLTKSI